MSKPSSLPVVARQESNPVISPLVPLNFVYPGVSLSQIFSIIWGHWKVSAIIIVIVVTAAVVTLKLLPRTYESEVVLMVNYEINDPVNGKNLPINQVGSYIATQMELIRNPELLAEVVDQLHLTENKDYAAGYNGKTGSLKQWVVQQVGKNLAVYLGQFGSQLIYVKYSANNPDLAAKVANTVADIYKKQDDERAINQPVKRSAIYAQQLSELKKNVELAQQEVTAFHKRHNLIDNGNNENADVVLLSTLEQRLVEAQNQRRLAEARASGDQSANELVLASQEVQALKAQLAEKELQLANLESRYTPEYVGLATLKTSIASIKQSLAAAIQKYSTSEMEKLRAARELENNLQVAIAKQRTKTLANSKLRNEAEKYILALNSAQAVYKRALDGYDELRFTSRNNYSNVSFVSRATPPLKYSKPKVLKGLIMSVVVAFMLGLGIPVGYELFNRRVRCRDDLERDHGIPVLAELKAFSMRVAT